MPVGQVSGANKSLQLFFLQHLQFVCFRMPSKKIPTAVSESALMDSENSVLATFDFLASENVDMDEDEDNLRYALFPFLHHFSLSLDFVVERM